MHATTRIGGKFGKGVRVGVTAVLLGATLTFAAPAAAQDDPNTGALTLTVNFDVPTLYYFRGLRQETDPGLTMQPSADVGVALYSGDGGLKSFGVNVGVWNSLHTGSSGLDGPDKLHYELDFYTTANFGFGGGVNVGATYTAYTYPALPAPSTVKEISFRVSKAHMLAPYGVIAFELDDDGQADFGENAGTYLELGVAPSWPLAGGKATVAVPVKVGMSLNDYYELDGEDKKFGFLDIGGLVTYPFTPSSSKFGVWNVHAGVDFLYFGDDTLTHSFNFGNDGESEETGFIALFGIGVSY